MTLLSYLQSLRYSDGSSVLVSRGALSSEEEEQAKASPNPYVLLFGLNDAESGRFLDGSKEQTNIFDCVLEHSPVVPGQVPDIVEIMRLYHLIGDAPDHVTQLLPGVPLVARLEYAGGFRPEQKHGTKDWLTATISFSAAFLTRF